MHHAPTHKINIQLEYAIEEPIAYTLCASGLYGYDDDATGFLSPSSSSSSGCVAAQKCAYV